MTTGYAESKDSMIYGWHVKDSEWHMSLIHLVRRAKRRNMEGKSPVIMPMTCSVDLWCLP